MAEIKSFEGALPSYVKFSIVQSKNEVEVNVIMVVRQASAYRLLTYSMVAIHPHIALVVGVVSRYMSTPRKAHFEAFKCISRYLKDTQGKYICHGQGALNL